MTSTNGTWVSLDQHLAVVVPGRAEVAATANVGVGHDDTAVEKAETIGAETERQGVAIGSVSIDIERILAALEKVFAVND